jgi:hypothetical protein
MNGWTKCGKYMLRLIHTNTGMNLENILNEYTKACVLWAFSYLQCPYRKKVAKWLPQAGLGKNRDGLQVIRVGFLLGVMKMFRN